MIQLGVNIDHVASVRQARYPGQPDLGEPDPVRAAHEAELGGADGITIHLREDRRHIMDRDAELLRRLVKIRLNLEMAATKEMLAIACKLNPDTVMLVPEGRTEVTTEGGLDVAGQIDSITDAIKVLHHAGLLTSAFIDADEDQIEACFKAGFDICEVHTGPYAALFSAWGGDFRRPELRTELEQVARAGTLIRNRGMRFNAGHALNYHNVAPIAAIEGIEELHIGHAIVSRAIFVGLRTAVADMKRLIHDASA